MPTPDSTISLRVDAVAGRMRRLLNDGMLALLAGVGDRAGLLRALALVGPASADAIARACALPPATAESWLAAMVAGRIVEYDGARATYGLPAETATFLAGAAGQALCARLGDLFQLGTGAAMAPHAPDDDQPFFDDLVRLVPDLGARLHGGARVLELGCGAGGLTCALATAHPASACTGRDPVGERIRAARQRARVRRLPNVRFVHGPALPARARAVYDLVVTLDERLLAPAAAPDRLGRVMAPGACGLLAVPATTGSTADDALHPFGTYLLGARALSPAPTAPGSNELGQRLAAAGFRVHAVTRLPDDAFRNFLIVEKQTNPPTLRTGERP